MPSKHKIEFRFLSPWHMGSGFGEGAHLDALPVKSASGLPYIPGRSVKGLFREAVQLAEECGHVAAGTTELLFGSRDDKLSRYETVAGKLRFSSATLGDAMEAWARENAEAVQQLYSPLASTKIEQDGLASDKTLRKIEVVLPVTLIAEVESAGDAAGVAETLRTASSLIRQAGSHRHRGLGRVVVSVQEVKQ